MICDRKILFVGLFIIIPLCLGLLFALQGNQHEVAFEEIAATVLPVPKALPNFSLQDHEGKVFEKPNLLGRWSMIFFGYTYCPDVCPTTLATLDQISDILRETPAVDMPQVIFISVDPARDTRTLLANYMSYFNDKFIGVTGSLSNLQALTMPLGVFFEIEGDVDSGNYQVFHSPRIMLIDPQARLKALFSLPHNVGEMVSAYKKIISL